MYEIITLADFKRFEKVTSNNSDSIMNPIIDEVTQIIEGYCRRKFITRQFTEFYNGNLLKKLSLNQYPIYCIYDDSETPEEPSNITVYDDVDREFTSSELIDAGDLIIYADEGAIALYNDEYKFYNGVQNVKVVYYAGLSRFNVIDEQNNYLDIAEDGADVAIEITPAVVRDTDYLGFNAEDLATAIQTALNASSSLSNTYSVSYSHNTQKFTISANANFTLKNYSGSNSAKSIASLIGFSTTADGSQGTSDTSDNSVNGLPDDIRAASNLIASFLWETSKNGKFNILESKKTLAQGMGTMDLIIDRLPPVAINILERYRRAYLWVQIRK